MPMFRRKPNVVEAVQWTGEDEAWTAICGLLANSELVAFWEADGTVSIEATDGRVAAAPGDWIVKSGAMDFSLCRRDAFRANFDPA